MATGGGAGPGNWQRSVQRLAERATISAMKTKRMLLGTLAVVLMVAVAACGSSGGGSSDGASDATTTVADSGGGSSTTVADGGGSSGSSGSSGSKIEASSSSGATISGAPSECTIDGTSGTVVAADGDFKLTFENGTGKLTWTYDGGSLDEEPAVMVTGKSITVSGSTSDGVGYNAEITCA